MARKSKKSKGLPSTVGQNLDTELLENAFTSVNLSSTAIKPENRSKRRTRGAEEDSHDGGRSTTLPGYEDMPRSFEKGKRSRKERPGRLPIKTMDGAVKQVDVTPAEDSEDSQDSEDEEPFAGFSDNDKEGEIQDDVDAAQAGEEAGQSYKPLSKAAQRQQILEAKEELAQIALTLSEDPEENIHLLRRLREISYSRLPTIQKLALGTQLAVFKNIIPGYRIRPLTEEEQSAKVTKDVKKLRSYEQALVSAYQQYVEMLAALARGIPPAPLNKASRNHLPAPIPTAELAHLAITCASSLALSIPHFNFRTDLLRILVDKLSKRHVDSSHTKAREAVEELFRTDEDGNASLDAVRLLVRMFKAKHFRVHESVLNTFLSLRLLSELDVKASTDKVDRRGTPTNEENTGKKRKRGGDDSKKAFKTKRARKLEREQNAVLKELKEADAVVSHEEKEKMQSEILKMVFSVYFRILKDKPQGGLMAATLEGLAKFAHLINIDFFTTLLTALKELILDSSALSSPYFPPFTTTSTSQSDISSTLLHLQQSQPTREALLCTATAFALLSGQTSGASSNKPLVPLDLTFFASRLYTLLLPLALNPDLELNHKSLRLPEPSPYPSQQQPSSSPHPSDTSTIKKVGKESKNVNLSTQSALLLRSLSSLLTPPHPPRPTPSRASAFTKRLLTFCLAAPEKTNIATLGLLKDAERKNRGPTGGAEELEERKGDGGEKGGRSGEEIEGIEERCNGLRATAWEVDLLRRHYSPKVRGAVEEVVGGMGEVTTEGGGGGGGRGRR
ncbi:nucleolar complex-associated protein-domain-containing protein [Kalaharituber pfeilii]|nr:nucleolar complex-associated protein-domain-containing protein [Kalaharituber pfeilii]